MSPNVLIFSKTLNSKFSYIEVWFTDQNSKLLGIEDKIKLDIKENVTCKNYLLEHARTERYRNCFFPHCISHGTTWVVI